MESFHEVLLTGNSEVCIVSGFSGAGKTCLVREALEKMTQEGALIATAKLDQFNADVPYTAMVRATPCVTEVSYQVQCIYNIAQQLCFTSSEDLNYFKHAITNALEKDLSVLVELVPLLEKLFPRHELPVQKIEISPAEAEERILRLIRGFLTCVATDERPLVLFIDDLQWSSMAETSVLAGIMAAFRSHGSVPAIQNCLLIISYRSNELSEALHQKLSEGLGKIRRKTRTGEVRGVTEITVGPLTLVFPHVSCSYDRTIWNESCQMHSGGMVSEHSLRVQ
jgi:predicted ATPase